MRTKIKLWAKKAFHRSYWKSVLVSLIYSMSTYAVISLMSSFFGIFGLFAVLAEDGTVDEYVEILIVCLVYFAFTLVIAIIAFLIKVYLINPLEIGCKQYWRAGLYQSSPSLKEMGEGFKRSYKNRVGVLCARDIYIGIWYSLSTLVYMIIVMAVMAVVAKSMGQAEMGLPMAIGITMFMLVIFFICFIPSYIKMLHYMFVPYILLNNPDMPKKQVFALSKQMMKGEIWNTTVLFLSFIGWFVLTACTYEMAYIFYAGPYMNYTLTAYYEEMRQKVTA